MTLILATEKLLSYTGRRLRERRVDEIAEAERLQNLAVIPLVAITTGGDVPGNYGFPATTEALVTVAFPNGDVSQWGCRIRANAVTHSGILAACLGEWARPYADPRYGDKKRLRARELIIKSAEERLNAYKEDQGVVCSECGKPLSKNQNDENFFQASNLTRADAEIQYSCSPECLERWSNRTRDGHFPYCVGYGQNGCPCKHAADC